MNKSKKITAIFAIIALIGIGVYFLVRNGGTLFQGRLRMVKETTQNSSDLGAPPSLAAEEGSKEKPDCTGMSLDWLAGSNGKFELCENYELTYLGSGISISVGEFDDKRVNLTIRKYNNIKGIEVTIPKGKEETVNIDKYNFNIKYIDTLYPEGLKGKVVLQIRTY